MAKVLDLDAAENKVCKQYRTKTYLKKFLIYLFQKKEMSLQKADEEFLNILENTRFMVIDQDNVDFMTQF